MPKSNQTELVIGEAVGTYIKKGEEKYLLVFGEYIPVENLENAICILEDIDRGYQKWEEREM